MNKICDFKGVPVYEDKYMAESKILRGRKENNTPFIVVAPDVGSKIKQFMRNDKLEEILGDV